MPVRGNPTVHSTPSDQHAPPAATPTYSDPPLPDAASMAESLAAKRQPKKLTKSRGNSVSNVDKPKAVLQKKNIPRLSAENDSVKGSEDVPLEKSDTTG